MREYSDEDTLCLIAEESISKAYSSSFASYLNSHSLLVNGSRTTALPFYEKVISSFQNFSMNLSTKKKEVILI